MVPDGMIGEDDLPIHSKVIAEEEASADEQTARSLQSSPGGQSSSVKDDKSYTNKSSDQ